MAQSGLYFYMTCDYVLYRVLCNETVDLNRQDMCYGLNLGGVWKWCFEYVDNRSEPASQHNQLDGGHDEPFIVHIRWC